MAIVPSHIAGSLCIDAGTHIDSREKNEIVENDGIKYECNKEEWAENASQQI